MNSPWCSVFGSSSDKSAGGVGATLLVDSALLLLDRLQLNVRRALIQAKTRLPLLPTGKLVFIDDSFCAQLKFTLF